MCPKIAAGGFTFLKLIVNIVEDSPELRSELDRMGFEATDE